MIDLQRLKVSLTKNGYLKLAELVAMYPRWDILDNCEGGLPGVNVKRNQVVKLLSADPRSGDVPEVWDAIREHGSTAIQCFTLVAVVFSHGRLIELFRNSTQGPYIGHFRRGDFGQEKEFTNLKYSLECLDLCQRGKGMDGVTYDLRKLVHALKPAGPLVKSLIELKLKASGWSNRPANGDGDFWSVSEAQRLHDVFGMEPEAFRLWLSGDDAFMAPVI